MTPWFWIGAAIWPVSWVLTCLARREDPRIIWRLINAPLDEEA